MNPRPYYTDAYRTQFSARVIERTVAGGRPAVVLDQSYFYPASGGQPHDLGLLGGIPVVEVVVRDGDEAVVHVLQAPLAADVVEGVIDWHRRFDHMQQHTGQHILSQAFLRVAEADTISFHLGADSSTIDLEKSDLIADDVTRAEQLANQIIWEDRPVIARFAGQEEVALLPLRRLPEIAEESLRLVEIEGFDVNACGGTHVSRTGAVGLVKILSLERRGAAWRIEFCCGQRALLDYGVKHAILTRLAGEMTTGIGEVEPALGKLRADLKSSQKRAQQQARRLAVLEAADLLAGAAIHGRFRVVLRVFPDRDLEDVRLIANHITRVGGSIALLGVPGERAHLILARSADAPGAMNLMLLEALSELGPATGGGSTTFAQGGGVPAGLRQIEAALARALAVIEWPDAT
jgi:alanyl-tRNA synthetase